MNPFVLTLLGIFFRQLVLMLAGAMGIGPAVHEFLDAHISEFNQVSIAVAGAVVTAAYAAYKQFTKRQMLVTALASPIPMSERECKELVKDPSILTPSVTSSKDEVPR